MIEVYIAIGIFIVATILLWFPRTYIIRHESRSVVSPHQILTHKDDIITCNWCGVNNWSRDNYCTECGHKLGVNKWI